MSPNAIFLFEIDKSFGPNVLAEYSLTQTKVPADVLKEFASKHTEKDVPVVNFKKDNIRYYSNKIDSQSTGKENLYLGFTLKENEDLVSMKSMAETIKEKIIRDYTKDKKGMENVLKESINRLLTLMDKLKEPALIVDTINDKTKNMLDEGKLQEARELIDLGEQIPEKLATEIKLAEEALNEKLYKKAKKGYLKAAEMAEMIQENEIVDFLRYKAEEIGTFPDLIKERDQLFKDVDKVINELQSNQLYLYHQLIGPFNRLIEIASSFENNEMIARLSELISLVGRGDHLAKELFNLDKRIQDLFKLEGIE
jgi:hypothetical protein